MPINPSFEGSSKNLRPDAVSFDYRTVFTLGPAVIGDASQGVITFPWRIRHDADEQKIYYSRASADNTEWLEEVLLFSYDGTVLSEIDAAFDQAGRVFVCGDRDSEVWAYYYSPLITAYAFESLGDGRAPRAILDNPKDTSNSDILIFYMNDTQDCLCYRVQKDRYQTEYLTPVTGVPGKFTEDATRSKANRIQVYYSDRDTVTGRYTMKILLSTLYPMLIDSDLISFDSSWLEGSTLVVVVLTPDMDVSNISFDADWLPDGVLELPVIYNDLDAAMLSFDAAWLTGGTLVIPVINNTLDVSTFSFDAAWKSDGTLVVVVITNTLDVSTFSFDAAWLSGGTLA